MGRGGAGQGSAGPRRWHETANDGKIARKEKNARVAEKPCHFYPALNHFRRSASLASLRATKDPCYSNEH